MSNLDNIMKPEISELDKACQALQEDIKEIKLEIKTSMYKFNMRSNLVNPDLIQNEN